MQNKITQVLLITLVLSLGFGQLLRFDYYGVPLFLHDVLVLFILLFNFKQLLFGIWNLGFRIFLVGLTLGWFFALLHYPLAQLLVPSLYTLRLLAYLALYFVLKKSSFIIHNSLFMIAGATTLIIGYLQYFLLPDMRVFQYLGWDDHLNRLTLPHFDPTFTAVMLGLFLLFIFSSHTSYSILHTLYLLPAILLTYSRSVWLSLAIVGLSFIRNSKIFLFSTFLFLICITFWLPKKFGEGTNLLRTYSISSRLASDQSVVKNSGWNLVLGQGMNTFPRNSINNSYLYLLATTGVLGLTGWLIFMSSLYAKSTHKPMLLFFFVASLFNNVMFYPFALLWVLLLESTVPTEV